MKEINNQSATLFAIAQEAQSLEEFGLLLRDWIHHITLHFNRPRCSCPTTIALG